MTERFLSPRQARTFYDRLGRGQDWQRLYEGPALRRLLHTCRFDQARRVFELGPGTGSLAHRLLEQALPPTARYVGVDISPTMVRLARARLAPFAERAEVHLADGEPRFDYPDGSFDRFLTSYVLDLLPPEQITATLAEAHRILCVGGRLCALTLTGGRGPVSRIVMGAWDQLRRWDPRLVGGCRPLDLTGFLPPEHWRVQHRERVETLAIASQLVIAVKVPAGERGH